MKDRGVRRVQTLKKKEKVKRILKDCRCVLDNSGVLLSPRNVGRMANTPHPCSCRCCGNPRRHEKGKASLTIQEIRSIREED
jgi:hypothetical protein